VTQLTFSFSGSPRPDAAIRLPPAARGSRSASNGGSHLGRERAWRPAQPSSRQWRNDEAGPSAHAMRGRLGVTVMPSAVRASDVSGEFAVLAYAVTVAPEISDAAVVQEAIDEGGGHLAREPSRVLELPNLSPQGTAAVGAIGQCPGRELRSRGPGWVFCRLKPPCSTLGEVVRRYVARRAGRLTGSVPAWDRPSHLSRRSAAGCPQPSAESTERGELI
jgi:hypothetical protein